MSEEQIKKDTSGPAIRIANTEQYRTFNLITPLPRNITVTAAANLPAAYVASIDAAIARYANVSPSLCLTFQRVASGGMITITNANVLPVTHQDFIPNTNTTTYGAAGGPSGGNPWNTVGLNVAFLGPTPNANFLTTVIAHEMGHCIGFRHTDATNISYSCGGSAATEPEINTGAGAVNIPGTPTTGDANSWMLRCLPNNVTNRPFNNNDVLALRFLYSCQPNFIHANPCGGIYSTATLIGRVGDVVTLRLSFGGYITWNGLSNGTGALISLTCGGQSNTASTPHYYGSSGFSLTSDITLTMNSQAMGINTTAVVNNSSTMFSSTATLTIVSVNGVANGNQGVVCGGNSGGSW